MTAHAVISKNINVIVWEERLLPLNLKCFAMKLIYKLGLCLLIITSLGCNKRSESDTESKKDLISINMNQCEKVSFDSLVESVSFIKLEKDNVPIFDFCHKIIQSNNNYYLLVQNRTGYEVLIFDNQGAFVKQIAFGGQHYFINTMFVHYAKKQLWVVCEQNTLYKYKLDGTFIEKASLPMSWIDVAELGDGNFLVFDGGFNIDWQHKIALADMGNVEKFFLKRNQNMLKSFLQNVFAHDSDNENIYVFPKMTDTIYHYSAKEKMVEPFYHLNFHGDFITEDMIPEDRYFTDQEMSDIITEKKYIYTHRSFEKASNKLFFLVLGKRNSYYMIDLADNSISCFDALFDGYVSRESFMGASDNNLLMVTKGGVLASHYAQRESSYPSIKEGVGKLLDEDNSWVLLNIKIKE